jgi:hypothetical protein
MGSSFLGETAAEQIMRTFTHYCEPGEMEWRLRLLLVMTWNVDFVVVCLSEGCCDFWVSSSLLRLFGMFMSKFSCC